VSKDEGKEEHGAGAEDCSLHIICSYIRWMWERREEKPVTYVECGTVRDPLCGN